MAMPAGSFTKASLVLQPLAVAVEDSRAVKNRHKKKDKKD